MTQPLTLTLDDLRLFRAYKIAIPEDAVIDYQAAQAQRDEYVVRLMGDILQVTEDGR